MWSGPAKHQDIPIPFVGQSLQCLVGEFEETLHEFGSCDILDPPETYDALLQTLAYAAPSNVKPIESPWTSRIFGNDAYSSNAVWKKYKPVDCKVRPVPSFMPDPSGQVFRCVEILELPALPLETTVLTKFAPTERITLE